jgi:hypothetical protein
MIPLCIVVLLQVELGTLADELMKVDSQVAGPGFTPGISQLYELLGQVGGCSTAAEAEELQREDKQLLADALSECLDTSRTFIYFQTATVGMACRSKRLTAS